MRTTNICLVFALLSSPCFISSSSWAAAAAAGSAFVGMNYGTQLSLLPSPHHLINLLKLQQITHLRLYDANSSVLQALAATGIQVLVTLPNTQLLSVGESNASAANWVKNNVLAYLPHTNITGICVGTEVLTSDPNAALVLVPAMKFLHSALVAANVDSFVKISTSHSPDIIFDSFPPSQAFFNRSCNNILQPMFDFLSKTGSFFMLNVYTYDIYQASNGVISLDYALFNPLSPNKVVVDSNTLLAYHNLFDAVLDSAFFAMAQLNYTNIPIVVSESGWPSRGDAGDRDATMDNAAIYNSNLIRHIVNTTAKQGVGDDVLQIALDWACGPGHADCSAIQPGKLCYEPETVFAHASYAFNMYFQKNRDSDNSCDFNGAATITTTNPSAGTCIYSGSTNTNRTRVGNNNILSNATSPAIGPSSFSAVDSSFPDCLHILFTFLSVFLVMRVSANF